jgi:hypothetical protein
LEAARQVNRQINRTQPYVVTCGNSYYIVADGKALLVLPAKFATALSDLIATYYAFNASYHKQLASFFYFIEVFVFSMKRKLPAWEHLH